MLTYTKNIPFVTTEANQNILTTTNIKNAIKERLAITSDTDYNRILNSTGFSMSFDIFCSATKVSINDGIYNELIEDAVYSSGGTYSGIKSIKIENNNINGILSFRII